MTASSKIIYHVMKVKSSQTGFLNMMSSLHSHQISFLDVQLTNMRKLLDGVMDNMDTNSEVSFEAAQRSKAVLKVAMELGWSSSNQKVGGLIPGCLSACQRIFGQDTKLHLRHLPDGECDIKLFECLSRKTWCKKQANVLVRCNYQSGSGVCSCFTVVVIMDRGQPASSWGILDFMVLRWYINWEPEIFVQI